MSVGDRRREGPAAAGVHEPDGLQGGRVPSRHEAGRLRPEERDSGYIAGGAAPSLTGTSLPSLPLLAAALVRSSFPLYPIAALRPFGRFPRPPALKKRASYPAVLKKITDVAKTEELGR